MTPIKAAAGEVSREDLLDCMNGYLEVHARRDGTFEIHGAEQAADAILLVVRSISAPAGNEGVSKELAECISDHMSEISYRHALTPDAAEFVKASTLPQAREAGEPVTDAGAAAMQERCAAMMDNRAEYFERAKGHRDWTDAARSYRATAKQIRDLPLPLASPPPIPDAAVGRPPNLPIGWTPEHAAKAAWMVNTLAVTPTHEWQSKSALSALFRALKPQDTGSEK